MPIILRLPDDAASAMHDADDESLRPSPSGIMSGELYHPTPHNATKFLLRPENVSRLIFSFPSHGLLSYHFEGMYDYRHINASKSKRRQRGDFSTIALFARPDYLYICCLLFANTLAANIIATTH